MTYREFCQNIKVPEKRVWFDRLISFYLDTGRGQHLDRVEEVVESIRKLLEFLDNVVGGASSIQAKYESENLTSV